MNLIDKIKSILKKYKDINDYIKAAYLFIICIFIILISIIFALFYIILSIKLYGGFIVMGSYALAISLVLLLILKQKLKIASILVILSTLIVLMISYFILGGMDSYLLSVFLALLTFSFFYGGKKSGFIISFIVISIFALDIIYNLSANIPFPQDLKPVDLRWIKLFNFVVSLTLISSFFFYSINRITKLLKDKEKQFNQKVKLSEELKKSVDEKSVLIREIHHRVKNNLQIVTSMLRLQSKYSNSKEFEHAVNESSSRIQSMSIIHEELYNHNNLAYIDFAKYIDRLISHLSYNYNAKKNDVNIVTKINNVYLNAELAFPFGLIVTELVTNSLKYAFINYKGYNKYISVIFNRETDYNTLIIKDNGNGLHDSISIEDPNTLGFTLVKNLVQQIDGEIYYNKNEGLEVIIKNKINYT